MFAEVTIRTAQRPESEALYEVVLGELGIAPTGRGGDRTRWRDFSLAGTASPGEATGGLHIGFVAPSRAHVDAFWEAGRAAGAPDAGAPGERPAYKPDYYGAFLLDPDGNSIEAVHHATLRIGRAIDHLWLRTADIGAAFRFYELAAPLLGLRQRRLAPTHLQVLGASGSFSVVPGEPTRALELAFPAVGAGAVAAFATALGRAGLPASGRSPGEAFVVAPDGVLVGLVASAVPGP